MDQLNVQLWVKMEPFLVGVLQLPPPSKFSMHYLRKMSSYVRTRANDGCYPRLSWAMWKHIACGKLQLTENLAWLYFEVFDSLVERTAEERLEWAETMCSCKSMEEYEKLKSTLSVDTLQFLLFLYIQQLNKVSLRSAVMGDEWPGPRIRSSPEFSGKSICQYKNWDDYSHLSFILTHLADLLELLLDPDQLTVSCHSTHTSLLPLEAIQALSFLIEGTVDKNRTVYLLHELALWNPLQANSGYSKISKTFSLHKLQAWLKYSLILNPFGASACIKSGKKLAWAQQVEGTTKRTKVACSPYTAPEGHRMVVMSQVYRQTLAKSSETLVGAHVKINQCNESFIYLLSSLRSVTIEKCRNSTFVLGPVQMAIHVQSCDNLKVIAISYRLSISSTSSCTFHILTPTRPLILSGNQGLILAPFHTHYPMLEDHMAQTGLATIPNNWDNPMVMNAETSDTASTWQLQSPHEFYVFVIPFEMDGDTMEIPGGLPSVYKKAMNHREQRIQIWQKAVKEASLTREQRKQFQALVEHKFNEWLIQTGNRQQLDSLVPPTAGSKQVAA
ncbi:TBCC domain-containing protein 1 isoform X1 [Microcaecilia unicolor]|uniref:TBCC domain-containing protein 1 n=1 Tax=Microcaecilia unicolor TaxID=1415580 RepID=A0A6P7YLD2_9AMPH|nr:TBCC domain-containing protein 1 isoform X1 [Microcaecilia unicolor]XP_030065611.1 TBCC domain-containing protein 1 isoform X1 [Microcaecilia unicolor]